MAKIDNKVTDIVEGRNLSGSQLDRLVDPKVLLMQYLSTHITDVQEEDPLLTKLKKDFIERYDDLSDGAKLRLFELLLKKQTEDHTPLINLFAKALETKKDPNKPGDDSSGNKPSQSESFSQEDMSKAKKLLSIVDKIEKGEFTPGEK